MANSGWVRFTVPDAVTLQVGMDSPDGSSSISTPFPAGAGNLFSSWRKSDGRDTIFYLINRTGGDVNIPVRWLDSSGTEIQNTTISIPKNHSVQAPASSYV